TGPAGAVAAVLGVWVVSSAAGGDCAVAAGGARCVRGDADGRREIVVLPVACRDAAGADGDCGVAADRLDAGPGGATAADGDCGGAGEQLARCGGAVGGDAAGGARGVSAAVSFAGAIGAREH